MIMLSLVAERRTHDDLAAVTTQIAQLPHPGRDSVPNGAPEPRQIAIRLRIATQDQSHRAQRVHRVA